MVDSKLCTFSLVALIAVILFDRMSIYRNTVWFVKGMREYTKGGYEKASRHFNKADTEVDVTGKSYMITGANSGLGKSTAIAIAQKGGTVHMVCRNETRGEEARQEIAEKTGNQNVFLHLLDMSKPNDIYQFVEKFKNSDKELDVLVNNAGCMVNNREFTEEGYEKNFATNTLGTYILTTALIPVLSKREKPKVVTVSSGGMLVQKLDGKDLQFEKMKKFDGTMAYAQNKRQQVVMTEYWGKQHPNIHFSSMHPGWADTPAVRLSMPDFHAKMKNRLRTPEEGADTLIWLSLSDVSLKHPSGLFFQDRVPVATHLPLAWTTASTEEIEQFMVSLEEIATKYKI